MQFDVDLTTHTPIYLQVMDQVKHAVASGEMKPGDQLPTVRQLAKDLDVNFNTVARAYRLLDDERIISTQHGRGTYILEPTSRQVEKKLRKQDLGSLIEKFLGEAYKLGFSPSEIQTRIEKEISKTKDNN